MLTPCCVTVALPADLSSPSSVSRELQSGMLIELFPGRRVKNPNEWYFVSRRERKDQAKIAAVSQWLLAEVAADPDLAALHGLM